MGGWRALAGWGPGNCREAEGTAKIPCEKGRCGVVGLGDGRAKGFVLIGPLESAM